MQNTIHFVLQAKGGIGKSFVSTLLAQYLLQETGAVRCFDTDQENTTFTHYEALSVRHVTVANQSRLIGFDFDENKNAPAPISKHSFDACDFHGISPYTLYSIACLIDK